MDIFGSHWKDHNKRLQDNWTRTVRPEDIVLIAGDLSWALKLQEAMADLEWIGSLPGTKIIIRGNHDYWWTSRGKVNSVLPDGMTAINANAWTRDNLSVVGTRGWNLPGTAKFNETDYKIYLRELNRLRIALEQVPNTDSHTIVAVLHFPPLTKTILSSGFTQLLESFGVAVCVYAHFHGDDQRIAFEGNRNGVSYFFVPCDYLDFQPRKIEL